ncbi:MAG: hypothetical protein IPL67_06095 [Ignavibacteria bacterium]|nr:hypothetical protein [Ignavibacteria bacterium]
MRIKVIVSVFILFVVLCIQNVSVAQNPTYALTAKNFDRTAPDSLTFEVYDLHTNAGAVPVYQYALRTILLQLQHKHSKRRNTYLQDIGFRTSGKPPSEKSSG